MAKRAEPPADQAASVPEYDPALNIYQRLRLCMCEVQYVQKTRSKGIPFSFASHDDVTALCRPAFIRHGVFVSATVVGWSGSTAAVKNKQGDEKIQHTVEIDLEVSFINVDDPKDRHTVKSLGYGIDHADKGPGKGISYAFKYAMLKVLLLETGDDPERDKNNRAPAANGGTGAGADEPPPPEIKEIVNALKVMTQSDDTAILSAELVRLTKSKTFDGWSSLVALSKSEKGLNIAVHTIRKALEQWKTEHDEHDPNVDEPEFEHDKASPGYGTPGFDFDKADADQRSHADTEEGK